MRSILSAAVVITALPIGVAQAAPISPQGFKAAAGDQSVIDQVQYRYAGREYCWYDDGWRGPGFYWCGYRLRTGFGWGGPQGWHGWRSAEFRDRGRLERRGGIGVEERGRTVGRGGATIEERGRFERRGSVGVEERGRTVDRGGAAIEERGRVGAQERSRVGARGSAQGSNAQGNNAQGSNAQGNPRIGSQRSGGSSVQGGTTGRGGTSGAAAPSGASGQGAGGGSTNAPSGGTR
jgi:hypothetical protein